MNVVCNDTIVTKYGADCSTLYAQYTAYPVAVAMNDG